MPIAGYVGSPPRRRYRVVPNLKPKFEFEARGGPGSVVITVPLTFAAFSEPYLFQDQAAWAAGNDAPCGAFAVTPNITSYAESTAHVALTVVNAGDVAGTFAANLTCANMSAELINGPAVIMPVCGTVHAPNASLITAKSIV